MSKQLAWPPRWGSQQEGTTWGAEGSSTSWEDWLGSNCAGDKGTSIQAAKLVKMEEKEFGGNIYNAKEVSLGYSGSLEPSSGIEERDSF